MLAERWAYVFRKLLDQTSYNPNTRAAQSEYTQTLLMLLILYMVRVTTLRVTLPFSALNQKQCIAFAFVLYGNLNNALLSIRVLGNSKYLKTG